MTRIIRARPFIENNTIEAIASRPLDELLTWRNRFVNAAVIAKLDKAIAFRAGNTTSEQPVQSKTATKAKKQPRKRSLGSARGLVKGLTTQVKNLKAGKGNPDRLPYVEKALATATATLKAMEANEQPKAEQEAPKFVESKPKAKRTRKAESLGSTTVPDAARVKQAMQELGFSTEDADKFFRLTGMNVE